MIKNIGIVMPGVLPVPAVQGGGIEQEIELLLRSNEKNFQFHFFVFTVKDDKATNLQGKFKHTTFINIAPWKISVKFGNLTQRLLQHFGIPFYYFPKHWFYSKVSTKISQLNLDQVIVENVPRAAIYLYNKNHFHSWLHMHNPKRFQLFSRKNRIFESITGVIGISNFILNDAVQDQPNLIDSKLRIIRNGVQLEKFSTQSLNPSRLEYYQHKLAILPHEKVVIYVGRTLPQKGIQQLIDAVKVARKTVKNLRLLIVGGSFYKGTTETKKISDSFITCTGFIDNSELKYLYKIADVAVFPSIAPEAAGLVQIEAFCAGTPALVTNSGGMAEYSLSEDFVVKLGPDFVNRLSEKILRLLSMNLKDDPLFIESARKYSMKYTGDNALRRLAEILS